MVSCFFLLKMNSTCKLPRFGLFKVCRTKISSKDLMRELKRLKVIHFNFFRIIIVSKLATILISFAFLPCFGGKTYLNFGAVRAKIGDSRITEIVLRHSPSNEQQNHEKWTWEHFHIFRCNTRVKFLKLKLVSFPVAFCVFHLFFYHLKLYFHEFPTFFMKWEFFRERRAAVLNIDQYCRL